MKKMLKETEYRRPNYEVTFFVTWLIAFISGLSLVLSSPPKIEGYNERRALSAVTLIVLTGYLAVPLTVFGKMVHLQVALLIEMLRHCKKRLTETTTKVNHDSEDPMTEKTGLMKEPASQKSHFPDYTKISINQEYQEPSSEEFEYHPSVYNFLRSPLLKATFLIWGMNLASITIACLIKPDLFNQFSGNSPFANNTFSYCLRPVTIDNNATCVFDFGYEMGMRMTVVFFPLILGTFATLCHYAGAEVTKLCQKNDGSSHWGLSILFDNVKGKTTKFYQQDDTSEEDNYPLVSDFTF